MKKKTFLVILKCFLLISGMKSLKNKLNEQKRFKTAEKKQLDQLLGTHSTQKLVEIHNNCSIYFQFDGIVVFGIDNFIGNFTEFPSLTQLAVLCC